MEIDLDKIINKSDQVLTEPHIQCLMKQLLEGLKAMHSLGVYHRDIKPANIFVNQDCQLRIGDFGLGRFFDNSSSEYEHLNNSVTSMTEYVVTRWYRAPEILLAPGAPYSEAIDIWSAGCVCAEMFLRKPLFPGDGYIDQVQQIFKVKGLQDIDELGFPVSESVSNFLKYRCLSLGESYSTLFPSASDEALQLLEAMLTVNPMSRPSASLALSFKFILDAEALFNYSEYDSVTPPPDYFSFEFSNLDAFELAQMIRQDVQKYSRDQAQVSEAETSIHSTTSIDSNESYDERCYEESPTSLEGAELYEHDSFDKQPSLSKERFSSSNPFGKQNSGANRLERQNSFTNTSVESSPTLDSGANDEIFQFEQNKTFEDPILDEAANIGSLSVEAALKVLPQEDPVVVSAPENAPTNAASRALPADAPTNLVFTNRANLNYSMKHFESNVLKPIDKQCKFSQSKGFPFTRLGKSLSATRLRDRSYSSKSAPDSSAISVLSALVSAPLQTPPTLLNPAPITVVGEVSELKHRAKECPKNSIRDRHRTQRFSIIDSDTPQKQKPAFSELLLRRPSRSSRVPFIRRDTTSHRYEWNEFKKKNLIRNHEASH